MISIKTPKEIDCMRRSGRMVAEILEEVRQFIQPGLTTREVDLQAAELMKKRKVKSAFLGYRGFPGHICIGVNVEVVHGIGSSRRIQYGDIVKIDIGIVVDGWIGDTATTVAVGMVSPEMTKLMVSTEESLRLGIQAARAGNRVGDISAAVESHAIKNGFSVVREFVGHGVGRKLHEDPQVPNFGSRNSGPKLKPGMTIAIEPMINMGRSEVRILADGWTVVARDGKPSSHYEHMVLIREEGEAEILTCREAIALT